ncbi:MAG TPA: hypothetical protein VM532_07150, partial [Burkholderiales bacterium]|nr:hypothetical protein [Burkholderiales bacterium]
IKTALANRKNIIEETLAKRKEWGERGRENQGGGLERLWATQKDSVVPASDEKTAEQVIANREIREDGQSLVSSDGVVDIGFMVSEDEIREYERKVYQYSKALDDEERRLKDLESKVQDDLRELNKRYMGQRLFSSRKQPTPIWFDYAKAREGDALKNIDKQLKKKLIALTLEKAKTQPALDRARERMQQLRAAQIEAEKVENKLNSKPRVYTPLTEMKEEWDQKDKKKKAKRRKWTAPFRMIKKAALKTLAFFGIVKQRRRPWVAPVNPNVGLTESEKMERLLEGRRGQFEIRKEMLREEGQSLEWEKRSLKVKQEKWLKAYDAQYGKGQMGRREPPAPGFFMPDTTKLAPEEIDDLIKAQSQWLGTKDFDKRKYPANVAAHFDDDQKKLAKREQELAQKWMELREEERMLGLEPIFPLQGNSEAIDADNGKRAAQAPQVGGDWQSDPSQAAEYNAAMERLADADLSSQLREAIRRDNESLALPEERSASDVVRQQVLGGYDKWQDFTGKLLLRGPSGEGLFRLAGESPHEPSIIVIMTAEQMGASSANIGDMCFVQVAGQQPARIQTASERVKEYFSPQIEGLINDVIQDDLPLAMVGNVPGKSFHVAFPGVGNEFTGVPLFLPPGGRGPKGEVYFRLHTTDEPGLSPTIVVMPPELMGDSPAPFGEICTVKIGESQTEIRLPNGALTSTLVQGLITPDVKPLICRAILADMPPDGKERELNPRGEFGSTPTFAGEGKFKDEFRGKPLFLPPTGKGPNGELYFKLDAQQRYPSVIVVKATQAGNQEVPWGKTCVVTVNGQNPAAFIAQKHILKARENLLTSPNSKALIPPEIDKSIRAALDDDLPLIHFQSNAIPYSAVRAEESGWPEFSGKPVLGESGGLLRGPDMEVYLIAPVKGQSKPKVIILRKEQLDGMGITRPFPNFNEAWNVKLNGWGQAATVTSLIPPVIDKLIRAAMKGDAPSTEDQSNAKPYTQMRADEIGRPEFSAKPVLDESGKLLRAPSGDAYFILQGKDQSEPMVVVLSGDQLGKGPFPALDKIWTVKLKERRERAKIDAQRSGYAKQGIQAKFKGKKGRG